MAKFFFKEIFHLVRIGYSLCLTKRNNISSTSYEVTCIDSSLENNKFEDMEQYLGSYLAGLKKKPIFFPIAGCS